MLQPIQPRIRKDTRLYDRTAGTDEDPFHDWDENYSVKFKKARRKKPVSPFPTRHVTSTDCSRSCPHLHFHNCPKHHFPERVTRTRCSLFWSRIFYITIPTNLFTFSQFLHNATAGNHENPLSTLPPSPPWGRMADSGAFLML